MKTPREKFADALKELRRAVVEALRQTLLPVMEFLRRELEGLRGKPWGEGSHFDCEECGPGILFEGTRCLGCGADSVSVRSTLK